MPSNNLFRPILQYGPAAATDTSSSSFVKAFDLLTAGWMSRDFQQILTKGFSNELAILILDPHEPFGIVVPLMYLTYFPLLKVTVEKDIT
jgi:hypothetical protein